MENGNGELTRQVLRAEIRAARAEDKVEFLQELDTRLKPVTDHIASIDRGEFSEGMKAGVVAVVSERKVQGWGLRSTKASVIAAAFVVLGFLTNTALALVALHHHP